MRSSHSLSKGQAPPRNKVPNHHHHHGNNNNDNNNNGTTTTGAEQNMTAKRKQGSSFHETMSNTTIPSLFDMCIKLLQNNIDDLPTLENIEKGIVNRMLGNCEPQKLDEIEMKNEDENVNLETDELWERFIKKEFGETSLSKVNKTASPSCRPHKQLYYELKREKRESESRVQKIQEESKRSKQSTTTRMIDGTKSTTQTTTKHLAKTIQPPIRPSQRIRNSTSSGGSRSSSSSSGGGNRAHSSSSGNRATSSAPVGSKKSKLWTSSLGENSTSGSRKKPEPTKNSIFIPGNMSAANNRESPMHMNRYVPPPVFTNAPLVYNQARTVSRETINYQKNRPSSPPSSDAIAGSPSISPSYVNDLFGKESSKRFDKVKRQSNKDSSKLRDSARAPSQRNSTTEQSPSTTSKSHHPPPSSHNSHAPPQKKSKPMNDPLLLPPPTSSTTSARPVRSSDSNLNFTRIPKKTKE